MLAPAVLYIVALVGFPFFFALYLSMTDATVGHPYGSFVGLKNFLDIVQSPLFLKALKNTFVFTIISQVIVLVLAKVLALALAGDFPGKGVIQFLILLPWVAPISIGAIGWLWIFDSQYSIIDWFLRALGVLGPNQWMFWLGKPTLAMGAVITVHVWRMLPFATVIILAGLTSIPQEILDAADVDGAGFWRKLFQITIPLLLPIMSVAVLFGFIFTFTDMTVIYVLTRGGPYDSTQVLASLAFLKGIVGGNLSVGAAISLFLFPLLLAAAILILRFARRAEVM
ncbi:MAG: sugar ABC transporter permease [Nitrospinota bacterium]|nr:MAG: sugar ABC transporter permease [Nitrospinota bacterium]